MNIVELLFITLSLAAGLATLIILILLDSFHSAHGRLAFLLSQEQPVLTRLQSECNDAKFDRVAREE